MEFGHIVNTADKSHRMNFITSQSNRVFSAPSLPFLSLSLSFSHIIMTNVIYHVFHRQMNYNIPIKWMPTQCRREISNITPPNINFITSYSNNVFTAPSLPFLTFSLSGTWYIVVQKRKGYGERDKKRESEKREREE